MAENDKDRGDKRVSPVDHEGWAGPVAAGVKIGGAYVENPDHVPAPTDQYRQYKTSGTGAHEDISAVSPIFDADRQALAVEAARALDPDDPGVPRERIILPDDKATNEEAIEQVRARAARAVEQPVVVGGPGKAELSAALSGPRGEAVAQAEDTASHRAVASNSIRAKHDTSSTNYPTADASRSISTPAPTSEDDDSDRRPAHEQHADAAALARENAAGAGEGDPDASGGDADADDDADDSKEQEQQEQKEGSGQQAAPAHPGKKTAAQKQTGGGRS